MKFRQPFTCRTYCVDENETIHRVLIPRCCEHRDSTAPGMAEDVPFVDSHSFANCRNVAGIVFDSRSACARRLLRRTASALIEEDQLALVRERCKRGPQHIVSEMKSAVDAEKRKLSCDWWTCEHGEFESASVDQLSIEGRRFSLFPPEREKSRPGGAVVAFSHLVVVTARGGRDSRRTPGCGHPGCDVLPSRCRRV